MHGAFPAAWLAARKRPVVEPLIPDNPSIVVRVRMRRHIFQAIVKAHLAVHTESTSEFIRDAAIARAVEVNARRQAVGDRARALDGRPL